MFCGKCGAKVKDGAAFCPRCGAQIGAVQQGQPASSGYAAQQPAPGRKKPAALWYALGGAGAAVLVAVIATVIIVAGRAVYQRNHQDDGKTASAEEASAENYAADDYAADDYAADTPTEDTAAAAEASSLGGGLYEVTPENVSNMLAEFFLLHLGCYIDYCSGNCNVEPENISSMMEHTGVIGLFTVADGMRVVDNYTEGLFSMKLKGANLSGLLRGSSQVEYGCTVDVTDINFAGSSFRYYEGTSANISAIVKLHYFVNGTEASFQNNYAMVNLVNNSGNPKDWLLTMAFLIDESDYLNTKSKGDVFDNYLVNEDGSLTDAGADTGAESREAVAQDEGSVHTYEIIMADCSWADAYNDCLARGGYLVRINSQEEYEAVAAQIAAANQENGIFWIGGGRNDANTYRWQYEDGSVSIESLNGEAYWLAGEPSLYDESTDTEETKMLMFQGSAGWVWNDVPDDVLSVAPFYAGRLGYICEYE